MNCSFILKKSVVLASVVNSPFLFLLKKSRSQLLLILFLSISLFKYQAGAQTLTYQTEFGTTGTADGEFSFPSGIAIANNGNIYVGDRNNERVQVFDDQFNFLFSWGGLGTGANQFGQNSLEGIAIDLDGNVWTVDRGNHRVLKFSANGTPLLQLGTTSTVGTAAGQFSSPEGITIEPATGNVYVTDRNNERVQYFNTDGTFIGQFGSAGNGPGQFASNAGATDLSFDSDGNLWVTDRNNHRVQKFSPTGTFLQIIGAGTSGSGQGEFFVADGVAVNPVSGDVFVADRNNERIQVFSPDGTFMQALGSVGSGNAQFGSNNGVVDIAFSTDSKIAYVVDRGNHRIQVFDYPVTLPQQPFVTNWEIPTDDLELTIPLTGTNFSIDWGDGVVEIGLNSTNPSGNPNDFIHLYTTPGNYTVSISSGLERIVMRPSNDRDDLRSIEQWGSIEWTSMQDAFFRCTNVVINAQDTPNLSLVTNMEFMFIGAEALNQPIGNWDVSNVERMAGVFQEAIIFNQDLSQWDMSNVTRTTNMFVDAFAFNQDIGQWNMSSNTSTSRMFNGAIAFNQDIGSWNMGNVTDMNNMFNEARAFNQDISAWNVGNVTDMRGMFRDAILFNQPLDSWNVSNVTLMTQMFRNARAFNQDLNNWNVSNVTDMAFMFQSTQVFNGKIDAWDVRNVKGMGLMFSNALVFDQPIGSWVTNSLDNMVTMFNGARAFNQDISTWDVSRVTDFRNVFLGARQFNQDISSWDVSNAILMDDMFGNAITFNQDLSNWDVSSVTSMVRMFNIAEALDHDFSSWNISQVGDMTDMFRNSGLSLENYDSTLIGWATLPSLQSNVSLGAQGLEYCLGTVARQTIIDTYGWSIVGDNQNCPLVFTSPSTVSFDENALGVVIDINANVGNGDDTGISYNLGGGNDESLFNINNTNGELSFISSPDFENPTDGGANNTYLVEVTASNGSSTASLLVTITVNDLVENVAPAFISTPITVIDENQEYTYLIAVEDEDGDAIDISATVLPSWLILKNQVGGGVSTTAGTGGADFINGNGTSAAFRFPAGVAVDAFGNIFVADQDNHVIRKIDTNGDVSTFAGSGVEGFADGPLGVARFNDPKDLTFDNQGNLIVADFENNRIRKVTPDGTVSTIAGTGGADFINGNGTSAAFRFPAGVAVDALGNIFVTDQDNHVIRKIDTNGDVSTFAGSGVEGFADGSSGDARFDDPKDLTFDNQGNLIVADFENNRIRKVTPDGTVSTIAGTGGADFINGNGTSAAFRFPAGVAVDALGNIFVTDQDNHVIRKIDTNGDVSTFAGSGVEGFADGSSGDARFDDPKDLTFDNQGNLIVADFENNRIRKIARNGYLLEGNTAGNAGTHPVTLIANDGSGGVAEQSFIITVNAVTPPVVITQDITVSLDQNGVATITPEQIDNGSNSAEGLSSLSLDITSFDCQNIDAPVTVTLTATSTSGISASGTALVTVRDVTAPEFLTRESFVIFLDENGVATVTPDQFNRETAEDNCGVESITFDKTTFNCDERGFHVINITATDASGNTTVGQADVEVRDEIAPTVITQNITVDLDANGNATITPEMVDGGTFDNCAFTLSLNIDSFTCAQVGENVVELTAHDQNGVFASANATVTVRDVTAPEFLTRESFIIFLDENGVATVTPDQVNRETVEDNCGVETITFDKTTFNCDERGFHVINITATDASGNTTVGQADVEVRDEIAPTVITQNITVDLDANGNATITPEMVDGGTFDNCAFTLSLNIDSFTCAQVGENVVELTAHDQNGVFASANATVTVRDVTAPLITLNGAADLEIELGNPYNELGAMVSDNCSSTLSIGGDIVDINTAGIYTITYNATDESSNMATQVVRVVHVIITVPIAVCRDVDILLDENGQATVTTSQIDNGSSSSTGIKDISIDKTSFDCSNLGANQVTLTIVGNNGLSSTCVSTVTVIDNIAPTVGAQNISLELDANGNASITPEDVLILDASDVVTGEDCTVSAAENHAVWLSNYVQSTNTEASHRWGWGWRWKPRKKRVKSKNTRFVFTAGGGNLHKNEDGTATVTGNIVSTTDATDSWTVTLNLKDGRNWQEWSALGRSYKDEQHIAGDKYLDWTYYEMAEGSMLTGTGRNQGDEVMLSHAPSNYRYGFQIGEAANSKNGNFGMSGWFFYKNRAGKWVQGDFNLDVTDCNPSLPPTGTVVTDDNCSLDSFSLSQSSFDCSDLGDNIVNVTVTDQSGNATTVPVTVTISDPTGPTAVAKDITVSLGANGTVTINPEDIDGGSTDNCGIVSYSLSRDTFDCGDVRGRGWGYYKRHKRGKKVTLTVTDAAGNTDSAIAYVTVVDDQAPEISSDPITVVVYGRRRAYLNSRDVYPAVTDNCGVRYISFARKRFTRRDVGMNSVWVSAVDYSGNRTTGMLNVNVVDISKYGRWVEICYNGRSWRVYRSHVQHWLRKGASLGSCSNSTISQASEFTYGEEESTTTQESDILELDIRPEIKLSTYPNPTSGYTVISFMSEVEGPAKVAVMNTSGVQLATLFDEEVGAGEEVEVGYETSKLTSGIYIIRLVTSAGVKTVKLLVRK